MEINMKFNKRAKLVSGFVNIFLLLAVLVVLFPLSLPAVKADTIWYDNWDILSTQDITLDDDIIIINGSLSIYGKLTLDNCVIQMRYKSPDDPDGNLIRVYGTGTFNVLNNSLITTNSTSPDPYEFRIDGTALINNSIIEKMGIIRTSKDGIQIFSSSVTITNSSVRFSEGNGLYIEDSHPNILYSNISNNNRHGVWIQSVDNYNFKNNIVSMNGLYGIYISQSSGNNITNNSMIGDGIFVWGGSLTQFNTHYINTSNTVNGKPVYYWKNQTGGSIPSGAGQVILANCTSISIENEELTNTSVGIEIVYSSNNVISDNNVSSNNMDGVILLYSNGNNITNNTLSFNNQRGIVLLESDENVITNNTVLNNLVGIELQLTKENIIINNNVSLNNVYGINIFASNQNNIRTNNLFSNSYYGIRLTSSSGNKVGENNISFNNRRGIHLDFLSNSNLITSNYLSNNTNYTLYMSSCNNNEIIDNILQNSDYGAYLTSSSNNILYHNNLKNNSQNNASDDGTNQWDNGLEGNWWGDKVDYTDTDGDGICDSNYTGTSFVDNKPLAHEDNDRVLVDDPWFWFIQSGVNFAEPGWTVYATASTYLENVSIDKTLTVIGEDRNSTIIDARLNESVVLVDSASYVNVSGFTVRNATNGIFLNNSHYCVLDDNNATNNSYGLYISTVSYPSNNNTISNNTIKLNNVTGIFVDSSNDNDIINNNILINSKGIKISDSSNIIVENNTISNNDIGIYSYNSSPVIRYNNISYNGEGIKNYYYSNSIIGNNTITHNNGTGVVNINFSNATIDNNTISNNTVGISFASSSPIITFNNITFNADGAIVIAYAGENISASDPAIHWNNIHDNTNFNLANGDITTWINATNNWWGSPLEDEIIKKLCGNVYYDPWLTAPIEEAGPG